MSDRTVRAVVGWLAWQGAEWLARIGVVALDPHRRYANASGSTSASDSDADASDSKSEGRRSGQP